MTAYTSYNEQYELGKVEQMCSRTASLASALEFAKQVVLQTEAVKHLKLL